MNILAYQSRKARFLGVLPWQEWRVKIYTLQFTEKAIQESEINELFERLVVNLPETDTGEADHGCAFLIIHKAADGDYALLSWWYGHNMLKHRVFKVENKDEIISLEDLSDTHIIACVWEMRIIFAESEFWKQEVMGNELQSTKANYLNRHIDGYL